MNQYITGAVIKELREKRGLTQAELAKKLNVSDKSVSKWETGKGYPDISLLTPIANVFGISVTELLSGNVINNMNVSANILRSRFYVCPVCGNMIYSMGEMSVSCHGIALRPEIPEEIDSEHQITIEEIEDELFIQIDHEMTKKHYISFAAALSFDRIQIVKLYPEGPGSCRLNSYGTRKILFYCNKDGLYCYNLDKMTKK